MFRAAISELAMIQLVPASCLCLLRTQTIVHIITTKYIAIQNGFVITLQL